MSPGAGIRGRQNSRREIVNYSVRQREVANGHAPRVLTDLPLQTSACKLLNSRTGRT